MSRIMALDWGERRVGVALSDETGTIASPLCVVPRSRTLEEDAERLASLVREHDVRLVVVGNPIRLDGTPGPAALKTQQDVERLRGAMPVPVVQWDERLSTAEAERSLLEGDLSRRRRRQLVDQVAAALFLQTYLDRGGGREP